MTAYYNEFNRKSAAALRQLIADGLIAPGDVDERSILDVTYDDIKHYTQCHFFAGIGGWSLALRMAGWSDDRPVWTGSCPCQPFSEAGGRLGLADERHLWPYWFELISQRGDGVLFGEQVEAAIRYGWLDLVRNDLEGIDHAIAAVGLPAACVGAPHIRQRLWFVADTGRQRQQQQHTQFDSQSFRGIEASRGDDFDGRSRPDQLGVVVDAERTGLAQRLGLAGIPGWALGTGAWQAAVGAGVHVDDMAHPAVSGRSGWPRGIDQSNGGRTEEPGRLRDACAVSVADTQCDDGRREAEPADHFGTQVDGSAGWAGRRGGASHWGDAIWIDCRDGKRRPIPGPAERGILLMADGLFYSMANVNAEWVVQTAETMIHGAANTTRPDETLRLVFDGVREEALQRSPGGPHELCETEVLLPFLQRVRSACTPGFDRSRFAQEDSIDSEEKLRGLRTQIATRCASLRRESDEQRGLEPADIVRELSQLLARCCAESAREARRSNASTFPLASNVKNRVALLHGSGNAIVPAVAAAFIQTYLETRKVIP